jgi:hypothetical protein
VALALDACARAHTQRAEVVTLRQRLFSDLAHIDRIIIRAEATGNAIASLRAIATRWALLERVRLCDNLDAAPDLPPADEDGGDVQAGLTTLLMRLIAGDKEKAVDEHD